MVHLLIHETLENLQNVLESDKIVAQIPHPVHLRVLVGTYTPIVHSLVCGTLD